MSLASPLPRLWLPRLVAAVGAFVAYVAHAQPATFLVGSDPVCDFTTVQAAVNAAATHPGPDFIHIAKNQSYNAQGIDIGAQDLDIIGGFDDCSAPAPASSTVLNGAGGSADSVFEVRGGGTRRFIRLGIANGDETDGDDGGGIDVKGSGVVELTQVTIAGGRAGRGGGLYVEAQGGPLVLELKAETVVLANSAEGNGGGLYIKGDVRLFANDPQVLISANRAPNGEGGGLYVEGPASVEIGSPGFNGDAVLSGNEARTGGGMSLRASDDGEPSAFFIAANPAQPVRIEGNLATERGGAVYASGYASVTNTGERFNLYFDGFVIANNQAADGAVVFADNQTDLFGFESSGVVRMGFRDLAASNCAGSAPCNIVAGNLASGPNGAVLFGDPDASFFLTRVTLRNNQGAHLVRLEGDGPTQGASFDTQGVAIVDNFVSQELFRGTNDADSVYLFLSTVAGNVIGGTHVARFDNDGYFRLTESIIDQPGVLTLRHPGGPTASGVESHRSISNDVSTLPTNDATVIAPVRFMDPALADYRLQAASAAVDFAGAVANAPRDLLNQPRDRNIPIKPDFLGPRDIGAYERQGIGNLVLNDRFSNDIRLWDLLQPEATTFNAASFDAGTGSFQVEVPGPTTVTTITAARQCIHLPGPGTYSLNGRGYGGLNNPLFQDGLVLQWVLRTDADDCGGPALTTGDLPIVRVSGWGAPAEPATFQLTASQWTINTTLELRLVVNRNPNDALSNGLFGRFDQLSLTVSGNELFRDGFE